MVINKSADCAALALLKLVLLAALSSAFVLLLGCDSRSSNTTQGTEKKFLFGAPKSLGEGREWRMYPLVLDVDHDGQLDIVASFRRPLHENSLYVWRGTGGGAFSAMKQTWSSPGYAGLAAGDINLDGKIDLVAASHFNRLHTYLAQDWSLGKFREVVAPAADGYIVARLADLDGDSKLELILLGNEKVGIEVYAWQEPDGWKLKSRMADGKIGRDLKIVDFDKDGKLDLMALMVHRGVVIFLQRENFDFEPGPETNFFSATKDFRTMEVHDLNADGDLDVVLNGGFAGVLKPNGPDVYLSDGKGGWNSSNQGLKLFKSAGEGIAVGDFNRDGFEDLIVGANSSGKLDQKAYGLFLFNGDGKGNWSLDKNSGLPERGLARNYGLLGVDINQDNLLDLVGVHGAPEEGSGYLSVWTNTP